MCFGVYHCMTDFVLTLSIWLTPTAFRWVVIGLQNWKWQGLSVLESLILGHSLESGIWCRWSTIKIFWIGLIDFPSQIHLSKWGVLALTNNITVSMNKKMKTKRVDFHKFFKSLFLALWNKLSPFCIPMFTVLCPISSWENIHSLHEDIYIPFQNDNHPRVKKIVKCISLSKYMY